MRIAILQSNYIPWRGYFDLINSVDVFVLYDCVQYTKNDWRNRNRIIVNSSPVWLTIPVLHQSKDQRIDETRVANRHWPKKHWATIAQSYARAAGMPSLRPALETLYSELAAIELLSQINEKLIRFVCEQLDISTRIIQASTLNTSGERVERLLNICKQLDATTYVSGPAAKDYMGPEAFSEQNIALEWFDYSGYPPYSQLNEAFEPKVSVMDLLLNAGKDAKNLISKEQTL